MDENDADQSIRNKYSRYNNFCGDLLWLVDSSPRYLYYLEGFFRCAEIFHEYYGWNIVKVLASFNGSRTTIFFSRNIYSNHVFSSRTYPKILLSHDWKINITRISTKAVRKIWVIPTFKIRRSLVEGCSQL